MSSLDDVERIQ